ncbi:hypothetical protein C8J56DRAFT_1053459 [Mycena floridula]|nr:hypothetical protein C8J56DRAFT_1053459 [Mycena floridula]
MSLARESSIASSRQASPHAKVPSVPEEPLNPEIAVLPVAPSSSPDANEPVPEPDELKGDKETPAKAQKRGKPSPSPAPRSPINKAQREPSPRPKSPSPAASPRGSPKPASPVMPTSNAPSEHQPSASPPPSLLKTPVPSNRPDPRFRIHSVRHAVYRELIENPKPLFPLSPSEMNLLQLGADDLNYWGYAIEIMYRQLLEAESQVLQVTLITTIASMFQQQNNFAIANACQEMDFPETSYILQLRSAVMRWFQDSHFPEDRLPSNAVEISMGPYLIDFDLSLLCQPMVAYYGNARRTAQIKSYHAEDIYHRPHAVTPQGVPFFGGPILSKGYISLLGEDPTKNDLICKAVRLGEASDEDSKDELVDGPSPANPWRGGTAPPLTGERCHFFTNAQKGPFDRVNLPRGFVRTRSADPLPLVVPTTQQLRSLRDKLGPFTVSDCLHCLQLDLPCAASANPGGACSRCLSDPNSGLCSHQMFFADVERSFSKTYQIVEANIHKLCRKAIELFSVEAHVSATRVLAYQGEEELDSRRRQWLRLYRHIALSSTGGTLCTIFSRQQYDDIIEPVLELYQLDDVVDAMETAYSHFDLAGSGIPKTSKTEGGQPTRLLKRNVFPLSITDSDSDDEFSQPKAASSSVSKKKRSKAVVEEEEGMADGEDETPRASTRDLRPRQGGSVVTAPRPVPTPTSKRSAPIVDLSDSETSLSSKRQKTGPKEKGKAKDTAAEDDEDARSVSPVPAST